MVVVDTSDPAARRLLQVAVRTQAAQIFRRTNVDVLPLSTAEAYQRPLANFFKARERRR